MNQTKRDQCKHCNSEHKAIIRNMLNGFAEHKMVYEDGKPSDYIFVRVNPAFEKLAQLKTKNIIGRRISEVAPEVAPEVMLEGWVERYAKVVESGEEVRFIQRSEGLGRTYSVSAFKTRKDHFAVMFEDVTLELEAEKVKHQEKRFQMYTAALDLAGVAILVWTDKGIRFSNKKATLLLGHSAEELRKLTICDLISKEDNKRYRENAAILNRSDKGATRRIKVCLKTACNISIKAELTESKTMGNGTGAVFTTLVEDIEAVERSIADGHSKLNLIKEKLKTE